MPPLEASLLFPASRHELSRLGTFRPSSHPTSALAHLQAERQITKLDGKTCTKEYTLWVNGEGCDSKGCIMSDGFNLIQCCCLFGRGCKRTCNIGKISKVHNKKISKVTSNNGNSSPSSSPQSREVGNALRVNNAFAGNESKVDSIPFLPPSLLHQSPPA